MDTYYPPQWRLQDKIDTYIDCKLAEIEAIESTDISADEKESQIELVLKQVERVLGDKDYEQFVEMVRGEK